MFAQKFALRLKSMNLFNFVTKQFNFLHQYAVHSVVYKIVALLHQMLVLLSEWHDTCHPHRYHLEHIAYAYLNLVACAAVCSVPSMIPSLYSVCPCAHSEMNFHSLIANFCSQKSASAFHLHRNTHFWEDFVVFVLMPWRKHKFWRDWMLVSARLDHLSSYENKNRNKQLDKFEVKVLFKVKKKLQAYNGWFSPKKTAYPVRASIFFGCWNPCTYTCTYPSADSKKLKSPCLTILYLDGRNDSTSNVRMQSISGNGGNFNFRSPNFGGFENRTFLLQMQNRSNRKLFQSKCLPRSNWI